MFSSTSFAEWTKVGKDTDGNTFYVDFERIRKHGGYVYWWTLSDLLKPTDYGNLSAKTYNQSDCNLFRHKRLSYVFYKKLMGQGTPKTEEPEKKGWRYPIPKSFDESILKSVCKYAK